MTAACNAPLITKLRRRSREDADPALAELVEDVESYLPDDPPTSPATQPVVSLDLRTPLGEVSLFTVIATLGAPLEVSAANLAIETFLPMDERSAAAACGAQRALAPRNRSSRSANPGAPATKWPAPGATSRSAPSAAARPSQMRSSPTE